MKVKIGSTTIPPAFRTVRSLGAASKAVRDFIEAHDLTAGCGSGGDVFTGGDILEDGEKIATVSYNGRVWDLEQREVKL